MHVSGPGGGSQSSACREEPHTHTKRPPGWDSNPQPSCWDETALCRLVFNIKAIQVHLLEITVSSFSPNSSPCNPNPKPCSQYYRQDWRRCPFRRDFQKAPPPWNVFEPRRPISAQLSRLRRLAQTSSRSVWCSCDFPCAAATPVRRPRHGS